MNIPLLPRPRRQHPVIRHVGWRGVFLATIGTVFMLLGLNSPEASDGTYALVTMLAPLEVWSWMFFAAGATAVVSGISLPPPKTLGFVALQAVGSLWGIGIVSTALIPGVDTEPHAGLIWLIFSVSILAVAHLREPDDTGNGRAG